MDIDQIVNDFLRDAQFRIAEIGNELDLIESVEDPRYKKLSEQRLSLYLFMDILYIGQWSIVDGYNHLDWSDYDINLETEYLRNKCEMITSPLFSFVGFYPQLVACRNANENGPGIPIGNPGDFIYYNNNSTAQAVPFPTVVGMNDGDTVNSFFS